MFLWEDAKDIDERVYCPYTGQDITNYFNTPLFYQCFAHVLPKGKYPYFKLNPKNVKVVHPEFHRIVDRGTSLDRVNHSNWKFNLWDNEVDKMKVFYQLFQKQNLLP